MRRAILWPTWMLMLLFSTAALAQPVTGNLGISTLSFSPTSGTSQQPVTVSFSVTNFGPGLGQIARYEVFVDGTRQVNQTPLTVLSNGSSVNINTSVTMPTVAQGATQSVEIRAVITGAGDPNTSNNQTSRFISVSGPALPDLTCWNPNGWSGNIVVSNAIGATTTPPTISAGTVYASFGYQTTAGPTPAGVPVRLVLNGFTILETPYQPLLAGQMRSETNINLGNLPAGSYTLAVQLDPNGIVAESNNSNNNCSITFQVSPPPLPDLGQFTPSGWPSAVFTAGSPGSLTSKTQFLTTDTVYLNASWANFGTAAAGAFSVPVLINGTAVGTYNDPGMPAQTFRTLPDIGITGFAPGVYQIALNIDSSNVVSESNETNNLLTTTISVSAPCVADFDGIGGLTTNDIFAFLNAWFAGDASADFDGMGGLSTNDVFAFLNAWFAGC